MPLGDKTGPRGKGARTGRGLGSCAPKDIDLAKESNLPRGLGGGYGRGFGAGAGYGRGVDINSNLITESGNTDSASEKIIKKILKK